MQTIRIEISYKTIIFTVFFILLLWLLFLIKDVILILFVSTILMVALEPSVRAIEKWRVPRAMAILLIYFLSAALLGIAIAGVIPPLADQTAILISRLPDYFNQMGVLGINREVIANQISRLGSLPTNLLNFIVGIFSNIITLIVLGVTTFYLLMERRMMEEHFTKFFGKSISKEIMKVVVKVEERLGMWVRGELILMTAVGLLSYLGFRLLGIEFALPLAILAGLLEVIPNFGPMVAAIPAGLAGLAISPIHGLAAISWAFLVQQVENNFIVPKVMQKATGLNPLVVIVSLTIGLRLAGVVGAALAIPAVLVLGIIFSEIISRKTSK
jgi:predicted PurR-regulated permease PerM